LNFHDSIRVLNEEEEGAVEEGAEPYSHYYKRNLYADIMPDLAGISNINTGICKNGWRNQDCGTFIRDAGISWTRIASSSTGGVGMMIILLFLVLI
jgi:hypothetical protein